MKKKSIFFTLLICLCSIFSTCGFFGLNYASATSTSASVWDGNEVTSKPSDLDFYNEDDNTYYIRSATGLAYFAHTVNSTSGYMSYSGKIIILETDIDLNSKEWASVGTGDNIFKGTFDGQNHTIYNMKISSTNNAYLGFFGRTGNATIKNLKFQNVDMEIGDNASASGVIAGLIDSTNITNCFASGKITVTDTSRVGGIVGTIDESSVITRCGSEVKITCNNADMCGGIVGSVSGNNVEISRCYNEGTISKESGSEENSSNDCYGGIVGCSTGKSLKISDSYNVGAITGNKKIGGILGYSSNSCTIQNVYNNGEISGKTHAGAIVGYGEGTSNTVNIKDSANFNSEICFAGWDVNGNTNNDDAKLSYKNVYCAKDVDGKTDRESNNFFFQDVDHFLDVAKTEGFYSKKYFSSDWNFSSYWYISPSVNGGFPYLKNVNVGGDNDTNYSYSGENTIKLEGSGTATDPYKIRTAGDLGWMSMNYSTKFHSKYYFALQNDIDLTGRTFQPIGDASTPFTGVFDGNNHTISGLTCSLQEKYYYYGLFGVTENAVIKNLIISNSKFVYLENASENVSGSFIGEARKGTYLVNCIDSSGISGLYTVGKAEENCLTVVYGFNSANVVGAIVESTIKLNFESYTKGYDVKISSDGGQFYNKAKAMYQGDYHIILSEDRTKVIDVSNIDTTYGVGVEESNFGKVLPTTSDKYGESDVLVKPGYKLSGYITSGNVSVGNNAVPVTNIGFGLTAKWTKVSNVTITVNYNVYEMKYFDATEDVTETFEVEYDSFLVSDHPEIIDASKCPIERTNFEIEGFYTTYTDSETDGGVFSNPAENSILNGTTVSTIYAKWKGTTGTDGNTITVKFEKTDEAFENIFKISDVVKSLTLTDTNGTSKKVLKDDSNNSIVDTNDSISFDFNTSYIYQSSKYDLNYLNLSLELKEGYVISGSVVYNEFSPDSRYGKLTTSQKREDNSGKLNSVSTLAGFNKQFFYNLSGKYEIIVTLTRDTNKNEVSVSSGNGEIFAVAPNVEVIDFSKSSINGTLLNSIGIEKNNVLFGYDFANNKILTSADSHNGISLDEKYEITKEGNNTTYLEVKLATGKKTDETGEEILTYNYYVYEMSKENDKVYVMTLYETNESWEKTEKLVTLKTSDKETYTASWLTGSNFTYIFSTQNDNLTFNTIEPIVNTEQFKYNVIMETKSEDGQSIKVSEADESSTSNTGALGTETKVSMTFSNLVGFENISVKTSYTKAEFAYKFVDENEKEIDSSKKPTIDKDATNYDLDVGGDGTLNIKFSDSRYYTFAPTYSSFVYDESTKKYMLNDKSFDKLKFNVSSVPDDDKDKTYTNGFNNSNSTYLEYKSCELIYGTWDNDKFSNDTFIFKISFKSNEENISYLHAGRYVVTIFCKKVEYTLETSTEFVKNSTDLPSGEKQEGNGITTTETKDGVLYDDSVTLETSLGNNLAYEFVGWYFSGYKNKGNVKNEDSMSFSFADYESYFSSIQPSTKSNDTSTKTDSRYKITATAVYLKKTATVEIDSEVVLIDKSDSNQKKVTKVNLLSLEFGINDNSDYQYEITDETSTSLHGLSLGKSGDLANAYYICGYQILDKDNNIIEINLSDESTYNDNGVLTTFDIYNTIKEQMENGLTEFCIRPIITQKTVNFYFHSGASEDKSYNESGHEGEVYYINTETITTSDVFKYETYYNFNNYIYLNESLNVTLNNNEENQDVVVDNWFANRKGYQRQDNEFWKWTDGTKTVGVNGYGFAFNNVFFENATGDTSVDIHFYLVWTANTYTVVYNSNGGTGTMDSSTHTYDIAKNLTKNIFEKTGYTFSGWATSENGTIVYDDEAKVKNLTDGNGSAFHLYAVWTANSYAITLDKNDGSKETSTIWLKYNTGWYSDSDCTTSITSVIPPSRTGYTFGGYYTSTNEGKTLETQIIDNEGNINGESNTFTTSEITLYADWVLDTEKIGISGLNLNLSPLTYTGNKQTLNLADVFVVEGVTTTGYDISKDENDNLSISLPAKWNSEVSYTISGEKVTIENRKQSKFSVKNVGTYYVKLEITIKDSATANVVYNETLQFNVTVNKATITAKRGVDSHLESAKKMIEFFATTKEKNNIHSCTTFKSLASTLGLLTEEEKTSLTEEEIKAFVLVKYYKMLTTTGNDFVTYKNWIYSDFSEFKGENESYVIQLVESLEFVEFYEYGKDSYTTDYTVALYNEGSSIGELTIKEKSLEAYSSSFQANTSYDLLIYVEGNDETYGNYDLNSFEESEGVTRYYIVAGQVFILPQIITLENTESVKYSYYAGNENAKVDVKWQGERDSIVYNDETYYFVANNIYADVNVYTSNGGNSSKNTEFDFTNKENFLYFGANSIVGTDGEEYVNLSGQFAFVLTQGDTYEIRGTNGLAQVTISARYLTRENWISSFEEFSEEDYSEILKINSVTYDNNGTEVTIDVENDTNTSEIFIYSIISNNANTVSILINNTVKSIGVSVRDKYLDDSNYIGFYKWTDTYIGTVNGDTPDDTTYEIDVESFEFDDNGLLKKTYFAVYTDLVYVKYNLNVRDDVTTQSTESVLKLGESTFDDLRQPSIDGLTLTGLTLDEVDILTNQSKLFAGANGEFVGISGKTSKHEKVVLYAVWEAEEMDISQLFEEKLMPVSSFAGLEVEEVAFIQNKNESLYKYSYEWFKEDGTSLSKTQQLTLANNGSFTESGTYTLKITAKIIESVMTDPSLQNITATHTLTFTLNFMRTKIVSVVLNGENSCTYSSSENITNLRFDISEKSYSIFTNGYVTYETTNIHGYREKGDISFVVNKSAEKVYSMRDAGEYQIIINFNDEVYEVEDGVTTEFVYTILPCEVDLLTKNISLSKIFNQDEDKIEKDLYLEQETVTLILTREANEDVGEYDLFVSDVDEKIKTNYTFKAGDIVVFENGAVTTAGRTTSVGKFTILSSGRLVLSYESSESIPAQLSGEYDSNGYTVEMKDNFVLEISKGGNVFKTITLKLYDEYSKKEVSSSIREIINAQISHIMVKFFDTETKEKILNAGTYTYNVSIEDEFRNYYSAVVFEDGFNFSINRILVNTSNFDFNKVYDGKAQAFFKTTGEKIADNDSFVGVYVRAEYSSSHVAENVKVELYLGNSGTEELSNYELASLVEYASITKKSAKLIITLSQNDFVYGDITTNNISRFVTNITVSDKGSDITDLLVDGYYGIAYSLPTSTSISSTGYVHSGTHTIVVESHFNDFDMEIIQPTIEISPLEIEKSITKGYITITAIDVVQAKYEEEYIITQTGDIVTLQYFPEGLTAGSVASFGTYDLKLLTTQFEKESIVMSLPEDNQGFVVLFATEQVYVRISDTTILTQTYNASEFVISIESQTLKIENGENTFTSGFSFFQKEGESEQEVTITFDTFDISGEYVNAGKNKLRLSASSSQYSNIVLAQDYYFEIKAKEIDTDQFTLNKTYDQKNYYVISDFDEKFEGDNVTILVKFENANAGENKTANLYLEGEKKSNYSLLSSTKTGKIQKASANVTLRQLSYTYGQIVKNSTLAYNVKSNEQEVSSIEYAFAFSIACTDGSSATYSSGGYLRKGTYKVTLTSVTSQNYDISMQTQTITVNAFVINPEFTVSGEVSFECTSEQAKTNVFEYSYLTDLRETITLTLTREEGHDVGSYRVISGVSNNENYEIGTLKDNSANGMFKLTKSKETLFLLLSSEDTISSQDTKVGIETEFAYDGIEYDKVTVQSRDTGLYKLVIYNSKDVTLKKEFELNYYTLKDGTYTKADELVNGLASTLKFLSSSKDVGSYAIYSSGTASSNFEVRMGKNAQIYSYFINITQKELYFKESDYSKVFDNKYATFEYEDASELVDGIISGEIFSGTFQFLERDKTKVAKYVGTRYPVLLTLTGENLSNYHLNYTTADGDDVLANITRASLKLQIDSQTFNYGQTINLEYEIVSDVDLEGYDMSRMTISLSELATDEKYSTSGALNVGEYSIFATFSSEDFNLKSYISDDTEKEELTAKILILPITLTLSPKDNSLTFAEIFTKKYDETKTAKITDESGNDLFDLVGIFMSDEVALTEATYVTEIIGEAIQVDFTLSGADAGNYTINSYAYGTITPVTITLEFDYDAGGENVVSNVDSNKLATISALEYPFTSKTNLTSNSASSTTNNSKNFPTMLTGKKGHSFTYWTYEIENVTNGSNKKTYLDKLCTDLNLTQTYSSDVYSIRVGNNKNTVELFEKLISDDQDLFGLYFKNNDNIKITFKANWSTNNYRVTVSVTDDKGKSAEYGTVEVETATGTQTVTNNFIEDCVFGTSISLTETALPHSVFAGFYVNGNLISQSDDLFQVGRDRNNSKLTIKNITETYNIQVRYTTQKINILIDLSDFADATLQDERFTATENKYLWETNYLAVENLTLKNLPQISRSGYNVEALVVDGTSFATTEFESTKIINLIGSTSDEVTLTIKPTFKPVAVAVTLDFGYDNKTQVIEIPFGQTYSSVDDWQENPSREGYDFASWNNAEGERIIGSNVVTTTSAHTLVAQWQIKSFDLSLIALHGEILQASVEFEINENAYSLQDVEYSSKITFKVIADEGYEISSAWSSAFAVTINADKTADIILTMPAEDFTYTLPIVAKQNVVTVVGENISEILAYDITETETPIDVNENMLSILTGRKLKVQISPEFGFKLTDKIVVDDENIQITKKVENGVLTIELENIVQNITLNLETEKETNFVEIEINNSDAVANVVVGNFTYNNTGNLPRFETFTNEKFSFTIQLNHGYEIGEVKSSEFTVTQNLQKENVFLIEIEKVLCDGKVAVDVIFKQYTLKVEVISYNEKKEVVSVTDNIAFVDGQEEVLKDFSSVVTLTYSLADKYSFVGWSKNGQNIFDTENDLQYTIEDDETIYAIFSTMKFNITLATYDYYTIFDEYGNASLKQEVFTEIGGAQYLDSQTEESISGLEIYYGASKSFVYVVPEGYTFYGFGYKNGDQFIYFDKGERVSSTVKINISSYWLDENRLDLTMYAVVKSLATKIDFETKIDVDGTYENDIDVGYIELVDKNATSVNKFGYVDGTRVHYDGVYTEKSFTVVAYTNDEVFVKIKTLKNGYKFEKIVSNDESLLISIEKATEEYMLYSITGIVGGLDDLKIQVLFKPYFNTINLSFENDGKIVDGGLFTIKPSNDSQNKIRWSGREYNSISVSAYTDSSFRVFAYIRAGYYITENDLQIGDENSIITSEIVVTKLSSIDTGYTFMIAFDVANYLGENDITISIISSIYSVVFKEGEKSLARLENVKFGNLLNIDERNSANITILDERIVFENGKLKLDIQKENHNFEGYFTFENGAGIRYIDANAVAVNLWNETGYTYDTLSGKYQLSQNAYFNEETQQIEISLYIYWSYLKTRISFEIVPSMSANITAKDMISGIDYTNSWFYETAPNYIEVAFNTNIQITAPELEGYKFYKYVISQKDATGLWLTDVEAYTSSIPWSTNELDRIVECNIQVIYFAQVEVVIVGGEGDYVITQDSSDTQARLLIKESFVDTTKRFSIQAVAGDGYEFIRWSSNPYGQDTLSLQITSKTLFIMNLQGKTVTLDFSEYDHTYGQILQIRTVSKDNSVKSFRVGAFSGKDFVSLISQVDVKVGDQVTFIMSVENGFAVSWKDRNDISYVDYVGGMQYFQMEIIPNFEGQTLKIIPIFDNTIISIYVVQDFVDYDDNSLDNNNVSLAGKVTHNGVEKSFIEINRGTEIQIAITTNARYEVDSVAIRNYGKTFTDFDFVDGIITLSVDYVEQNSIIGIVQLQVHYCRKLWNKETGSFDGDGTSSNPYQIKSQEDLALMMKLVNSGEKNSKGILFRDCAYILLNDLDLSEKFWTPIGTEENMFNGYFNFNDHNVSGIYNSSFHSEIRYNGLFGVLGANARIVKNEPNLWYIYLIVGIVTLLAILLTLLIVLAKRRRKRREELSTK